MNKDQLKIWVLGIGLTVAGFMVAYQFVEPAPPKHIRIATGSLTGAYYSFGNLYKELLKQEGITLEVKQTAGSVANIGLLEDPKSGVDVAFVQGGTADAATGDQLVALASLYYEPLWVFTREGLVIDRLTDLRSSRVAIGPEGSGTRAVALELLEANKLDDKNTQLTKHGGNAAANLLLKGELDAAMVIASPRSALVSRLIRSPGISVMNFARHEAYTRRNRSLSSVTLPEGAIDLDQNLPPENITLLAPTASLVTREELHPALMTLLVQTAKKVHADGGLFSKPGQFPSSEFVEFPMSEETERYLVDGPSFLHRILPFWAATLIDRLKVMLLPLVTLLYPLAKILPPTYKWRVENRIYRWYKDLHEIEVEAAAKPSASELRALKDRVETIEDDLVDIHVPLSYASGLYELKAHVDGVRQKLGRIKPPRKPRAKKT
jgi:uncharacterized protein